MARAYRKVFVMFAVPAVGTSVIVRLHKGGDLLGTVGETPWPESYVPLRMSGWASQWLIPVKDVKAVRRG